MDRLGELRALYQDKSLPQARELYEREPGRTDPEWYWLGSLVYWHLGQPFQARMAAHYGLGLAPRGEIRMKLLYQLGTAEETLGAYGEAIEHLEECLAELPAYPSLAVIMQGAVLYNVAIAYYNRNTENVVAAIHYYERAAAEFRRENMNEYLRMCLQNLTWALCDIGEAAEAAELIDQTWPLCTTDGARQHQIIVSAYRHLIDGDRQNCLMLLEPFLSREDDTDAFVFALSITALAGLGLHSTDPGMLDRSAALLQRAMLTAMRPGADPRCWTTANRVQKRLNAILKEQNRGA